MTERPDLPEDWEARSHEDRWSRIMKHNKNEDLRGLIAGAAGFEHRTNTARNTTFRGGELAYIVLALRAER